MNRPVPSRGWVRRASRFVLGALFVYFGLAKALDPAGFLKLLRQFDLLPGPFALNLTAAVLPWCEMLCGAALVFGLRVQAAALAVLVMLASFTIAVTVRAWSIYQTGPLSFCAIHFDCGCGSGEVVICVKLLQNTALAALAGLVVAGSTESRGDDPT